MIDFAREVDDFVPGALNPGEEVIWTGHCLSLRGKQDKASPGPGASAGSCLILLIVQFVIFLAVLIRTGTGLGLLAIFPIVIVMNWVQRKVLHSPDEAIYCRKQTVYVLTDQRAMVLRNCQTAYPAQSLLWAYADEVRAERVGLDGRGTVQFLNWDVVEQRWVYSLRFFMVANALAVAERAIAAREAARG
jgi:hypothetical protein